jgi:hypothetical protein
MTVSPKFRLTLVVAVAALTLFTATALTAQEVLTNDSLVALKKAGLSDAIIISKIRSSQTKFDVSTKGLIGLKNAGFSDQVIEAVVNAGSASAAPPAATAPAAPAAPAAAAATATTKETIYHLAGGKYVELNPAASSMETNVSFYSNKSELVLKGKKAQYRVTDKKPVFYSAWGPNEAPLVRMKPGSDHDDRNLKIGGGSFMPFGGTQSFGVRSEDRIDVDAEKDARGLYKMSPKEPLKPGEYAFVLTFGSAAGSGRVYDFGID